jgi:hypothetical protein
MSIISYIRDAAHHWFDNENDNRLVFAVAATLVLLGVGWISASRVTHSSMYIGDTKTNAETSTKKRTSSEPNKSNMIENSSNLRNVFSVKQKSLATGGGGGRNKDASDRPFGSFYYYAHNNENSKGGYADGLRAEDYVMNGPRLLSRGGVRVHDESDALKTDDREENSTDALELDPIINTTETPKLVVTASQQITRYLWDDDGDGDIAKIHIDSLPKSSTETMPWQDASISKDNVEVRLTGVDNDGLIVEITSQHQTKYYLRVPKLYGSAESAKAIVKKHKLMIKITKRKIKKRQSSVGIWGSISGALFGQTESYRSVKWPQLSYTGSEIDDKLFKEIGFKDGTLEHGR